MSDNGESVEERWERLGLYDPTAVDAAEILETLEFFESIGVDPNDFVGVSPTDLIPTVNINMLAPGRRFDAEAVRTTVGLDEATFTELCAMAGYDPAGSFTPADVETFRGFTSAAAFFSREELDPFIRVLRSQMSHVAEALTALFRIDIGVPLDRAGASQLEHAKKNWESAQLIPHAVTAMNALLSRELTAATLRSDQSRQATTSGNAATVTLAIGFVDIVGYTPLADSLAPDDLGAFIVDFERKAAEAVSTHDGRVVKLIGDEVMFVVVDPDAGMSIAQDLIDAFADSDATPRAGVVYGEMVARGGDYYGSVVNLAARISAQAAPGEVLTDAATVKALRHHLVDPAGNRTLKGFDEPVPLCSIRR